MAHCVGIDIGSTCTKVVAGDGAADPKVYFLLPTGWSSAQAADQVQAHLAEYGIALSQSVCVATGYGRVAVPGAAQTVTEITCHARGACWLHGTDALTVIDVGGQDTKIIAVRAGKVSDFVMNDKCSAGTGRFLDVMANSLGVRQEELCALAAQGKGVTISSLCTVFAESEVIGLVGRGEARENIAHAVIDSIVKKVATQARRLVEPGTMVCLTGGLGQFTYICEALARELQTDILAHERGQYAGAIGAYLNACAIAQRRQIE